MFKLKKAKRVKAVRVNKKPNKLQKALKKIGNFKIIRVPAKGFESLGGYFVGAWKELKLVRWPNRKATWGLTFAVLLFTTVFALLILLLDFAFKELFNLIIK